MTTRKIIQVRAFPVWVMDRETGRDREELVVLEKEQLQAAQLVGQSSKELIERLCGREGLEVLQIGKAEKREIAVNLDELYNMQGRYDALRRAKVGGR